MKKDRCIVRLLRDCHGATIIEFAFAFPVFLLLLFGIIEFSLFQFGSSVLENSVAAGARQGITGSNYGATDGAGISINRENFIAAEIRDTSLGLLDPANLTITTEVYNDFEEMDASTMTSSGYGCANQAVVITATYDWPFLTPLIGHAIGSPAIEMKASTLMVNENFDSSAENGC